MVIEQSIQHDNRQIFMIDVLNDCTTHKMIKRKHLLHHGIFVQKKSKEIVKQMIYQECFVCFLK